MTDIQALASDCRTVPNVRFSCVPAVQDVVASVSSCFVVEPSGFWVVVVVVVVVCCCVFCWGVLAGGATLSTTMMSPAGTGFGLTVVGISLGDTGCETVLSAGCVVPVVPTGFVCASTDLGSLAGSPVR